ncbi:MAG: hypothetical protein Q8P02_01335 [Candidatus Micrarchaeota archaeon]|nr:hypothetical protein [Candidatus Micrarchaeota archaeon]
MDRWAKLAASLGIDALGMLTAGAGDLLDLAWAPMSALLVFGLYRRSGYSFLAFGEEILPGFDVIPTATIAWLDENGMLDAFHKKGPRRNHPVHGRNRTITLAD